QGGVAACHPAVLVEQGHADGGALEHDPELGRAAAQRLFRLLELADVRDHGQRADALALLAADRAAADQRPEARAVLALKAYLMLLAEGAQLLDERALRVAAAGLVHEVDHAATAQLRWVVAEQLSGAIVREQRAGVRVDDPDALVRGLHDLP